MSVEMTRRWLHDYRLVHSARHLKSPLFPLFRRLGAKSFLVYNHCLHAVDFDGQTKEQEYEAIRHGVTIWDVSVERPVEIDGPDGFKLMDLLTPRDMRKCQVGQCKYAIICDENGGIVNDPVVVRLDENRFWLCPADSDLHLWVKGVAVGMGLRTTVRQPEVFPIQIQGPKSAGLLQALVGDRIKTLRYYWWMNAEMEGRIPIVITRTGWTGEVGYEIFLLDNSRAEAMIDVIMAKGKAFGLIPAGPNHPRRVEAGILNYQADMSLDTNPYELGLDWQVDLAKERFIGKDALVRVKRDGIRRKLVGLLVEGEQVPIEFEEPWHVYKDGRLAGRATAVLYSPSLKTNIGYAMVGIEHSAPGGVLEVQPYPEQRRFRAKVVPLPFVDPKKDIPKIRMDATAGR
jgi:glycine cleavage system aminomethyltransferase T